MKKVLVIGSRGFLGKYVMEHLKAAKVDAISAEDLIFVNGKFDIRDNSCINDLPTKDIGFVIHLAAALMIDKKKPKEYFDVNAIGTYNILEYCRRINASLLFAMTHSDVNASQNLFINEGTPRCFTTNSYQENSIPFIASKVAAMEMIEAYNRSGFQGIIFRIANMRGVGSKDTLVDSVFHQFIRKAQRGEPIELWGECKTLRDLIYVKDVARAIASAIIVSDYKNIKGLYNIGSGKGLTIRDEAETIINVFSGDAGRSILSINPDIPEVRKHSCIFEITKARVELDWQPWYTYHMALHDMKKIMDKGGT